MLVSFMANPNTTVEPEEWLIMGITPNGRPFRPSDWAERLCGVVAQYNRGRLIYSVHAQPVSRQGQICLVVETVLRDINLDAYEFIMGFARDNQLKVVEGRSTIRQSDPVFAAHGVYQV